MAWERNCNHAICVDVCSRFDYNIFEIFITHLCVCCCCISRCHFVESNAMPFIFVCNALELEIHKYATIFRRSRKNKQATERISERTVETMEKSKMLIQIIVYRLILIKNGILCECKLATHEWEMLHLCKFRCELLWFRCICCCIVSARHTGLHLNVRALNCMLNHHALTQSTWMIFVYLPSYSNRITSAKAQKNIVLMKFRQRNGIIDHLHTAEHQPRG